MSSFKAIQIKYLNQQSAMNSIKNSPNEVEKIQNKHNVSPVLTFE